MEFDEKKFCDDIRALLSALEDVKSSSAKTKIKRDIKEMLAYEHKKISINPAKIMNGATSDKYPGYFVSAGVKKLNEEEPSNIKSGKVTDEHIMPKDVIFQKIYDIYEKAPEDLINEKILYFTILISYSCLVTKDENEKLNKGLRNSMPGEWTWPEIIDYSKKPDLKALNFFARYKEKEIECSINENQKENIKTLGKKFDLTEIDADVTKY